MPSMHSFQDWTGVATVMHGFLLTGPPAKAKFCNHTANDPNAGSALPAGSFERGLLRRFSAGIMEEQQEQTFWERVGQPLGLYDYLLCYFSTRFVNRESSPQASGNQRSSSALTTS
jgi:hypothetical protein